MRGARPLCIILLASVTTWSLWHYVLRDRYVPYNFGVVEPQRLYRSGQISRHVLRKTLTDHQIGLIIDLSDERSEDAKAERRIADELQIPQVRFFLGGDGTGKPENYEKALAAIIQANRNGTAVLVHCQAGAQRTGGVIAAYRILVEGVGLSDAFKEAQRYGYDPVRNPRLFAFVERQLPEWEAKLIADHLAPHTTAPAATRAQ